MTAMAGSTELRWGGASDIGRVRSNNQDHFLAREEAGIWVVADGMGGHRGGEIASRIACDTVDRSYTLHTIDGLVQAVESANAAVFHTGSGDPDLAGMGTTIVAIALVDDGRGDSVLAIANVGDSRAYRLSGTDLEQLTNDHSLVADLVREGSLSPEEAAVHPQRNILTRVLGVYDDVPVDVVTVVPHNGDRFVLCSDGLFNEVPEPAISSVLRRLADPADAANELVRLANEGGGPRQRHGRRRRRGRRRRPGRSRLGRPGCRRRRSRRPRHGHGHPARRHRRRGRRGRAPGPAPQAQRRRLAPVTPSPPRRRSPSGSPGGSRSSCSCCWRWPAASWPRSSGTASPPTTWASRATGWRSSRAARAACCGSSPSWSTPASWHVTGSPRTGSTSSSPGSSRVAGRRRGLRRAHHRAGRAALADDDHDVDDRARPTTTTTRPTTTTSAAPPPPRHDRRRPPQHRAGPADPLGRW